MMNNAALSDVLDPWARLALGILNRAKHDAARGDLAALAWLVYCGVDIADAVQPGTGGGVIAFCQRCMRRVDNGELVAAWEL